MLSTGALLLLSQAATTWAMVGVIWLVQLLVYPQLGRVPAQAAEEHAREHARRISRVVVPLMLLELGGAVGLVVVPSAAAPAPQAWLGLGLLALVWGSTWALQVPLHARLQAGWEPAAWEALVRTNWLRTFGWSARGVLVTAWLAEALSA